MPVTKTIRQKIEPSFVVSDTVMPGMEYAKVGSKFKVIIDYQVIEKTKGYTALRVMYVHQLPKKRIT